MKKLLILLNILLFVLVLPSCGGEDEPQIDDNTTAVTPESVEFTAAGGSRTVSVRTEAREWDATTDASWLKLAKNGTSGKSGSIYVDGKMLLSFSNDRKGDARTWPFNKAFYVILNLAWGGDWGGAQGVDEGCLPATMEVDYVRVFQKD